MTRRFAAGVTVVVVIIGAYVALCQARGVDTRPSRPAPTWLTDRPATAAEVYMDPSVQLQMAGLERRVRFDMMLFASPPPSPRLAIVVHGIAPPSR